MRAGRTRVCRTKDVDLTSYKTGYPSVCWSRLVIKCIRVVEGSADRMHARGKGRVDLAL